MALAPFKSPTLRAASQTSHLSQSYSYSSAAADTGKEQAPSSRFTMTRTKKRGGHGGASSRPLGDSTNGQQVQGSARTGPSGPAGRNETTSPWSKRNNPRRPYDMAGKRKIGDGTPHTSRPARRQRTESVNMEYDYNSIYKNMSFPGKNGAKPLPKAGKEIVQNPKTIKNAMSSVASFDAKYVHVSNQHSMCTVTCTRIGQEEPLEAMGEGLNQVGFSIFLLWQ